MGALEGMGLGVVEAWMFCSVEVGVVGVVGVVNMDA